MTINPKMTMRSNVS